MIDWGWPLAREESLYAADFEHQPVESDQIVIGFTLKAG
jgi:hypothetical protein